MITTEQQPKSERRPMKRTTIQLPLDVIERVERIRTTLRVGAQMPPSAYVYRAVLEAGLEALKTQARPRKPRAAA